MTSDMEWDPTSYDNVISKLHQFYDPNIDEVNHVNFDDQCNYLHCTVATQLTQPEPELFDEFGDIDDILDALDPNIVQDIYQVHHVAVQSSPLD
jgi:hypothetical protein